MIRKILNNGYTNLYGELNYNFINNLISKEEYYSKLLEIVSKIEN